MPDLRGIPGRSTLDHQLDAYAHSLLHGWPVYTVAGLAVLGLVTAAVGRVAAPQAAAPVPPEPFDPGVALSPTPSDPELAAQFAAIVEPLEVLGKTVSADDDRTEAPSCAAQPAAEEVDAATRPEGTPKGRPAESGPKRSDRDRNPRPRNVAAVCALTVASLLAAVISAWPSRNVGYIAVAGFSALLVAWYVNLGRRAPMPLVVAAYTACVGGALLGTVPVHNYTMLALIAAGLGGTALVLRSNVILNDEDRHVVVLITSCLLLHVEFWLLLLWIPLLFLLMFLLMRHFVRQNRLTTSPAALAIAISGLMIVALTSLLAT